MILPSFPLAVDEIDFDFYSTAAQVIPLIFVALAFEFRGQGGQFLPAEASLHGGVRRAAIVYSFLMGLVLVGGEVVALHVIAYDNPWNPSRLIVGAVMAVGALGVIALIRHSPVQRMGQREADSFYPAWGASAGAQRAVACSERTSGCRVVRNQRGSRRRPSPS